MGCTIARWCAALALAALVASILVVSTSGPASAAGEGTILALVNQSRAANGLGPLSLNSSLSAVSTAWANQMAANGAMTHNPDFSSQIPGGWSHAGENVARGYATPTDVHNGWMNSPGHRANILGDYTDIGIAFISAGGTTWAVENFAKYGGSVPAPAPPAPPAPAPAPPPVPAPAPAPPAPPPAPPAQTAPAPATPVTSSPSTTTPSTPGTSAPMPSESASARRPNHNPSELTGSHRDGSKGTLTPLDGLPDLLIGILLGLLVLMSSAWTGVLLRRRWQK